MGKRPPTIILLQFPKAELKVVLKGINTKCGLSALHKAAMSIKAWPIGCIEANMSGHDRREPFLPQVPGWNDSLKRLMRPTFSLWTVSLVSWRLLKLIKSQVLLSPELIRFNCLSSIYTFNLRVIKSRSMQTYSQSGNVTVIGELSTINGKPKFKK